MRIDIRNTLMNAVRGARSGLMVATIEAIVNEINAQIGEIEAGRYCPLAAFLCPIMSNALKKQRMLMEQDKTCNYANDRELIKAIDEIVAKLDEFAKQQCEELPIGKITQNPQLPISMISANAERYENQAFDVLVESARKFSIYLQLRNKELRDSTMEMRNAEIEALTILVNMNFDDVLSVYREAARVFTEESNSHHGMVDYITFFDALTHHINETNGDIRCLLRETQRVSIQKMVSLYDLSEQHPKAVRLSDDYFVTVKNIAARLKKLSETTCRYASAVRFALIDYLDEVIAGSEKTSPDERYFGDYGRIVSFRNEIERIRNADVLGVKLSEFVDPELSE